jgi:hypothetical protein
VVGAGCVSIGGRPPIRMLIGGWCSVLGSSDGWVAVGSLRLVVVPLAAFVSDGVPLAVRVGATELLVLARVRVHHLFDAALVVPFAGCFERVSEGWRHVCYKPGVVATIRQHKSDHSTAQHSSTEQHIREEQTGLDSRFMTPCASCMCVWCCVYLHTYLHTPYHSTHAPASDRLKLLCAPAAEHLLEGGN